MTVRLHRGDLPDLSRYRGAVAIDTETMGLDPHRDRLCVVQLSPGDGSADVVQIPATGRDAPNLKRLLADPAVLKIFHFARFDIAALYGAFGVMATPLYCTKIASRLARTYTDKHGLKDLVREMLGIELSKQHSCAQRQARRSARARGPGRARRGLLPVPARSGAAGSRRLGRGGHFRAFVSRIRGLTACPGGATFPGHFALPVRRRMIGGLDSALA